MARKLNIPKDKQIKGLRKALANRKTPKQFLPSLRKRLAKLTAAVAVLFVMCGCAARPAAAQTPVIIQPTQQILATNLACTGTNQTFPVNNRNQPQHYASIVPSVANTSLTMVIQGKDSSGNVFPISDTVFSSGQVGVASTVAGTGYFPIVNVVVACSSGTFTLSYTGTAATSNISTGSYLAGAVDKAVFQNAPSNTTVATALFTPPFGTSLGKIIFTYQTAGIANSTINAQCNVGANGTSYTNWVWNVANTTQLQIFQVPDVPCQQVLVGYTSGGASANTFRLDYVFDPPGTTSLTSSAQTIGAAINEAVPLAEKGARWSVVSGPAVSNQATASKALGAAGVRHVADCVTISAGASTAPAATQLTINLRDGATGAGTIIWSTEITAAATATNHGNVNLCGLNLIGTAATAMTLEFSALLTNEFESVTLTGYDVQ